MIVLAIETSCDETAVAILKDGKTLLSNAVLSQIDIHTLYGGVVPEIASRHHIEAITHVLYAALKEANVTMDDVDVIAVTEGPGLIGSLLVGINAAKALALAHQKPLVGVNHLAGHIYASALEKDLSFPLVALLVSGGHTELILMEGHFDFKVLGQTLDDAVGEAYDKVGRVLGLPYPGGPHVDRLAQQGKDVYQFPRVMLEKDSLNFSFSGLKSAVINRIHNAEQRKDILDIADVCASFQESVLDVLMEKTKLAVKKYGAKQLIVAGGVAANKGLRTRLNAYQDVPVLIPAFSLCTDNAAMIAVAAHYQFLKDPEANGMSMKGNASLSLQNS